MTTDNCCCDDDEATLYLSEDFAGEQVTTPLQHWSSTPEAYVGDVRPFVTVHGRTAGHYYAQAQTNEKTPWQVASWKDDTLAITGKEEFSEFCISWAEYFEPCYPFAPVGQKMFRAGYDNSNHPESKKEYGFSCLHGGTNLETEIFQGMWGDDTYGSLEWAKHTNVAMPVGKWVEFRVWVKLNTPGMYDGFVRVDMDGWPLTGGESLNIRNTDPRSYNYWWCGGNFTCGPGEVLPSSGSRYITDIRWRDTAPET